MKVKMLDQPLMLVDQDTGDADPIWYENPVSKEKAERINRKSEAIIESLKDLQGSQVPQIVSALLEQEEATETKGLPWTIRRAMISTLYANRYALAATAKDGTPKPEKQEVVAQMQSMGYAFQHAPKMGFVVLDAEAMQLARRKMYELPLPGVIAAEINHYFDQLEDKTKTEVIFGVDSEDIDPSSTSLGG